MSAVSVRLVLLVTLVVSLTIRHQAISASAEPSLDSTFQSVVQKFVRANQLTMVRNPYKPDSLLASLTYFQRKECDQPSIAMPFRWNLEPMAILRELKKTGDTHEFWYFDQHWQQERLPRSAAFVWWLWYSAADALGQSDFYPSNYVLAIVNPKGCLVSAEPDWKQLWRK